MTVVETRSRVQGCLTAVGAPLYEGVVSGFAAAEAAARQIPRFEETPALLPLMARHCMRTYWEDQGIGDGWSVEGNPALMGQVLLVHHEQRLQLRLLKERSLRYPGGVPVAGSNKARRRAWTQPALGQELVECEPDECELLLLWDCLQQESAETYISVRVVHPTSPGTYGRAVPIDMNFEIKPGETMFDSLSFPGEEEHEMFFPTISREDNGAASGDG